MSSSPASNLDEKLSRIFRAAFPSLRDRPVESVTRTSLAEWDSIASLTLANLLAEEFGETFDLDEAAEWASYAQIRGELETRFGG